MSKVFSDEVELYAENIYIPNPKFIHTLSDSIMEEDVDENIKGVSHKNRNVARVITSLNFNYCLG